MYPLHAEYEQPVIQFIKSLKSNPDLKVVTNVLSTQVFGALDDLMPALGEAMKLSWVNGKAAFVVKFLPGDLAPEDGKYLLDIH